MNELTYLEIIEHFNGDESLVDAVAESLGIDRSYCESDEDYEKKIAFSFNSESGANCPITQCWISSSLVWKAASSVMNELV